MHTLKYPIFILIGSSSYGVLSSIVKLAVNDGYRVSDIMLSQYAMGIALLLCFFLFTKKKKLSFRMALQLLAVGTLLGLTGITYNLSIAEIPASFAVVLLFQFTWMGVAIEAVSLKRLPSRMKLISVLLLWAGTFFAGGLVSMQVSITENLEGIGFGLAAALFFALYLFFSGKAAKGVPPIERSLIITGGGLLVILAVFLPSINSSGGLPSGIYTYSLPLALCGIIFPVVFLALGSPHVESGIATIISAAELPASMAAAMLIVGEPLTLWQTAGVIIILAGITVPCLPSSKRKSKGKRQPKQAA